MHSLSLSEAFLLLSEFHSDFIVNASHHLLLRSISIDDILIAGVEATPFNSLKSSLGDSLVCIPVQRIPIVHKALSLPQNSHAHGSNHLLTAYELLRLCLNLPALMCNIDHLWLEMDSAPVDSLSLFIGSSSSTQTEKEVDSIFLETHNLVAKLRQSNLLCHQDLQACFENLSFLLKLFG